MRFSNLWRLQVFSPALSLEYQLGRIDLLFLVEIDSYKIIYSDFRR